MPMTELRGRLLADYEATTDADEQSKLSDELEKSITEHFEVRQKIRGRSSRSSKQSPTSLQELHDRGATGKEPNHQR